MNDTEHATSNSTCERVQAALDNGINEATVFIQQAPDLHDAFHASSHMAATLRDAAEKAADLRAEIVSRIAENEELSLAKLADRVGVSKARAGQLMQIGKRVQQSRLTESS